MRKTISLFTGCGGLDLGLHAAGFQAAVAVELDAAAVATLRLPENAAWWSETAIIDQPIEAVSSEELMARGKLEVGEAKLLAGGPPCQPFSKSGYWHSGDSRRLDDPRAGTLTEYLRVLEDLLPEAFLLENVPGLAYESKNDGLALLEREVKRINAKRGTRYSLVASQLNAAEHGVPQTRERVFVIGQRDGKVLEFPKPTHALPPKLDLSKGTAGVEPRQDEPSEESLLPCATAWDAIGGWSEPNNLEELALRGKWADLLPSIPEGSNYLYHTSRGNGEALFGWRRRYWSMLLKLSQGRPSWTLTAQPGPAIGPFHWSNRRLSAREMSALQTFPEGYTVQGTIALAQRQIGNAVPSALAERLGLEIRRQLLGESDVPDTLTLAPAPRSGRPVPTSVARVAEKYRAEIGEHEDHPGTGKGPGAVRHAEETARQDEALA